MTDLVPPQTIQRIEHLDRSALKDQLIKGKNVSFLAHGNGFCACTLYIVPMWHES